MGCLCESRENEKAWLDKIAEALFFWVKYLKQKNK